MLATYINSVALLRCVVPYDPLPNWLPMATTIIAGALPSKRLGNDTKRILESHTNANTDVSREISGLSVLGLS